MHVVDMVVRSVGRAPFRVGLRSAPFRADHTVLAVAHLVELAQHDCIDDRDILQACLKLNQEL